MTADPFVRDRLHAVVDSEQLEIDRLFREITAASTVDVEGAPPSPRRRWPVAAGALVAAAAAIALVVWAISSHTIRPEHRHSPTPAPNPSAIAPTPTPTATPAPESPTGGRLVFVGARTAGDPAGSIYRMNAGDHTPVLLQTALGLDQAAGSPDGRNVAYIISGEASGELRVIGVDGLDSRTITTKHAPQDVAWSPDSSALVFSSGLGGALYRINAGGSGLTLMDRPLEGCSFRDPAWSPDGTRVAFAEECAGPLGRSGIGIADVGDGRWAIYAPTTGALGISWSPDGSRLAFSAIGADGDHDVQVLDVGSGLVTDLTPDAAQETSPAWSPDGEWIAFARDGEIWAMQPDGSHAQPVSGASGMFVRSLSWTSPPRATPPEILPPPSGRDVQAVVQPGDVVWAMAESGGEVWTLGDRIVRIDPSSNAIDYAFGLPDAKSSDGEIIGDGHGGVFFTHDSGLWHVDTSGDLSPRHVPTVAGARSLALGAGRLWVLTEDSIVVLDPATSRQLQALPLEPDCACGPLVYFDGSLWLGDRNPVGGVDRIDPATGRVLARIQAGSPAALVVADGELWDLGDPGVFLIDPASNTVRNTADITAFEGYADVTATVGDGRIWANGGDSGMSAGSSVVQVIDPGTGRLVRQLDVFGINQGRCRLAVAGGSLWETCAGYRTDDHGRVIGELPQDRSYVVRVGEPSGSPAQSPGGSGLPALEAVDFVDAQRGWIGGDGVIESTTDGGATWTRQYAGPARVVSLQFVDPFDGWALGEHELLRTMDGGAHWAPALEPAGGLSQVQFVDSSDGWGVSAGALVRTTDGGTTWDAVAGSPPADQVCFGDRDHGWLASASDAYRSTDGGRTWTKVFPAPVRDEPAGWRSEIGCTGPDEAWLVVLGGVGMSQEAYAVFRTGDGGGSWIPVADEAYYGSAYPDIHLPVDDTIDCYAGSFSIVGPGRGAFVGTCDPMDVPVSVSTSADGGQHWDHARISGIDPDPGIAIAFGDDAHGWLVGAAGGRGVVFATIDGGRTWKQADGGT